jgi:hypothetical protein
MVFFLAVWLWWQELWRRWRRALGFSLNKGLLFSLWRLCVPVFRRNTGCPSVKSSLMLPWWWRDSGGETIGVFFNKLLVLLQANHIRLPPPARGRSSESFEALKGDNDTSLVIY